MATIYPYIQLKRIEFQSDKKDVMLTCKINQENQIYSSHYLISHSELNKIIGELQQKNSGIDLYELLEKTEINDELVLYTLDFEQSNIENTLIPPLHVIGNSRQIRA